MGALTSNTSLAWRYEYIVLRWSTSCYAESIQVNGLLWDDASERHIARHGVTREEVEYVVVGAGFRFARIDDSH